MKLVPTRRTDYAIRALLFLAERPGELSKAAEISEQMDIPKGFLHQVLQDLQRARLVTSQPSRHGGYALMREAEDITILTIIESLEGPIDDGDCALRGGPCRWEDVCALHWVWSAAREAFAEQMESATLAQVAEDDAALARGTRSVPANAHRKRTKRKGARKRR